MRPMIITTAGRWLCVPKSFAAMGRGEVPRAMLESKTTGRRGAFILVARVGSSSLWYCHCGNRTGRWAFPNTSPWDPKGLETLDVVADAWGCEGQHGLLPSSVDDLRRQILESPREWSKLVADATWQAEELRASKEDGRPMEFDVASSAYERDPFRYDAGGHASQAPATFAWCWYCDGVARFHRVEVRLNHAPSTALCSQTRLCTRTCWEQQRRRRRIPVARAGILAAKLSAGTNQTRRSDQWLSGRVTNRSGSSTFTSGTPARASLRVHGCRQIISLSVAVARLPTLSL